MAKTNSGLLEFKDAQKVFIALDDATSEVKKAVIIAADGTETDIAGGGGGDVTVEALSVTENGTYSEEGKAYSPVTVNVESDFSTAVIEVTVTGGESFVISNAFEIYDEHLEVIEGFETGTFMMVLYKGVFEGVILASEGYNLVDATGTGGVAVSADALGNKAVNITGDGTLTVELASN